MGGSMGGMPGLGQQPAAGQSTPAAPAVQAGSGMQQQLPQWLGQLGQGQTGQAPGAQMSGGVGNLIQALMQGQMQSGASGNPLSQFMGSAWGGTPAQTPTQLPAGNNMFSQLFAKRTQ